MIFGITKQYAWGVLPFIGFGLGWFLDHQETLRMTIYRDRSSLYGRQLKSGEEPSWP